MAALYRDVYDDVVRCAHRKRERDTLLRRIESARSQLAAQRSALTRLSRELAKEEGDVRRLRSRSFLALVARLAGARGRTMDAQREHAISARLRHDAQEQTVASLQLEVVAIARELMRYEGIDEEYERVFLDKAHDLVLRGGPTGARVADLSAELVNARGHAQELDGAIVAGQATLHTLMAAHRVLVSDDRAERTWEREAEADRSAERHLGDAQTWAFRFARELEDLEPWNAEGPAMAAIAGLLLHYVDDLIRNAARQWSPGRTRAAMDGLRGFVEVQLRRLEATRASVVTRHDATERRYIEVVALG